MSSITPKVSFVIYYPFQFYFYKNIYLALAPDAEFVVDLCHPFSSAEQAALQASIVALLDSISAPYRVIKPTDYHLPGYLEIFFSQTNCLISTWEKGCVTHPATSRVKKVRCAYGLGKELTMVRPSGVLYDLTLAHGARDAANFSLVCPTEIVGLPKFDEWFTGDVGQVSQGVRDYINSEKPTVLYLPTHGDLSSVEMVAPQLTALSEEYNVIAKMHYATARAEMNRRELLERSACLVVDDTEDILPLLKVTDVVLSDNSSAIFEAMLADVPVVVTDFWQEDYFIGPHRRLRRQSGGAQAALTYPGSLEQIIKRDGSVVTCQESADIADALAIGLLDSSRHKRRRQEIGDLFTYRDGACGMRAAQVVRDLVTSQREPKRPILYYALIDSVERDVESPNSADMSRSTDNGVEQQPGLAVFHIDDTSYATEDRQNSLLSILTQRQEGLKDIAVTVYTEDGQTVSSWIKEWHQRSAFVLEPTILGPENTSLGQALQNFFRTHHVYASVTHASVQYSMEWLRKIAQLYTCFPQVGAITAGHESYLVKSSATYHDIPPQVLHQTVFRTKFMLGITLSTFRQLPFEAVVKQHLIKQADWMMVQGLVTATRIMQPGDWHEVGQSERLVGVPLRTALQFAWQGRDRGWKNTCEYIRGFVLRDRIVVYKR